MKNWSLAFLLIVLCAGQAIAQPGNGQPFPSLVLQEDNGGKLGGGAWRCEDMIGKPCLIVLVDPDQEELLAPLESALSALQLSANEGRLVKVMDTRASWKPDQLIKAGTWISQMTEKVNEARENGILQALFTERRNKPATWSVVYDQNEVFRTTLRLSNRPVHMFLLDRKGMIISYAEGNISKVKAQAWIRMLKQLAGAS